MTNMSLTKIVEKIHYKCRNTAYPRSPIFRFVVPDDKVSWNVQWSEYDPVAFTSPRIKNQPWADPDIDATSFQPLWNAFDGKVNRTSHERPYKVINGFPHNPMGRTGVTGRGLLGRWGPNHAADPVVTRWRRREDHSLEYCESTGRPILQFVGIKRKDCREWAIPGGMVDPGETISDTLKREFMEEALSILSGDEGSRKDKEKLVEEFFTDGTVIYKGYVDDPRNTDNAWIETVATNFHDEDGKYLDELYLEAGDDASKVKWIDINSDLNLYASHLDCIFKVAQLRNSHW